MSAKVGKNGKCRHLLKKKQTPCKPAKPAIAEFAEIVSAKVGKARQNQLIVIVIVKVIVRVRVIVKVIYLIKCSYGKL